MNCAHLSEHKSPPGCRVEVDDLDQLVEEWKARRPESQQVTQISPWNAKPLVLEDPFGNLLGINHHLPEE